MASFRNNERCRRMCRLVIIVWTGTANGEGWMYGSKVRELGV